MTDLEYEELDSDEFESLEIKEEKQEENQIKHNYHQQNITTNNKNDTSSSIKIKKEPIDLETDLLEKKEIKASSRIGTKKLRSLIGGLHQKKRIAIKNFKIDSKKEKEKQVFLNKLKKIIAGEQTKAVILHSELKRLQTSVFENNRKKTDKKDKHVASIENKKKQEEEKEIAMLFGEQEENNDEDSEDDILFPYAKKSVNKKIENKSKQIKNKPQKENVIATPPSSNKIENSSSELENILKLQRELDERQRILSSSFQITNQYLDSIITDSQKNQLFLNKANKTVEDTVYDLLRYVNHNIMDHQMIGNMYISSRTTKQDIYEANPLTSRNINNNNISTNRTAHFVNNNVPLFRNNRINGHVINASGKEQIQQELKKVLINHTKKRRYNKIEK